MNTWTWALALLGSLTFATLGHADELTGKQLTCSYTGTRIDRSVHKTFHDFLVIDGQKVVVVTPAGGYLGRVANYDFQAPILALDVFHVADVPAVRRFGSNPAVYDLSNPSQISRTFERCVYPGQGGGDARNVCETDIETCELDDASR